MSDIKNGQTMCEYMTDSLFHGMRSILGDKTTDFPRLWHMYKDDKDKEPDKFSSLYGKGFTLYGLLPSDSEVSREEIYQQTQDREFDLVVSTVHCSAANDNEKDIVYKKLKYLSEFYPKEKLVFIDTRDSSSNIYNFALDFATCFKREFVDWPGASPISFSIPKEKIVKTIPNKSLSFASAIPWHPYRFMNEQDYYNDYQTSLFGYSCKKGGWDSMRHYEILANACTPYFTDLNECPKNSLFKFPKELVLEAMSLKGIDTSINFHNKRFQRGTVDMNVFDIKRYSEINQELLSYTREHLTTESMAKYLLEKVL